MVGNTFSFEKLFEYISMISIALSGRRWLNNAVGGEQTNLVRILSHTLWQEEYHK